jgi:hypothetical protein
MHCHRNSNGRNRVEPDDAMVLSGAERQLDCRAQLKLAALPMTSALTVPILVR